jgi:hypothetical protein
MRDEITRRGVNTGKNGITGITLFNGRAIRRSNVNFKAPEFFISP